MLSLHTARYPAFYLFCFCCFSVNYHGITSKVKGKKKNGKKSTVVTRLTFTGIKAWLATAAS